MTMVILPLQHYIDVSYIIGTVENLFIPKEMCACTISFTVKWSNCVDVWLLKGDSRHIIEGSFFGILYCILSTSASQLVQSCSPS